MSRIQQLLGKYIQKCIEILYFMVYTCTNIIMFHLHGNSYQHPFIACVQTGAAEPGRLSGEKLGYKLWKDHYQTFRRVVGPS